MILFRKFTVSFLSAGRTPDKTKNNPMAETPLRWGARGTRDTIVASSEGPSSGQASSPTQGVQMTSPLAVGMSEIDLSSPLYYGTPSSLGSIRTPRGGVKGTPIRQRPDIRTDKRLRQVNIGELVIHKKIF